MSCIKKYSSASILWTHIVQIEKLKRGLLYWLGKNDAASNVTAIVDSVINNLCWSRCPAGFYDLVNIQSVCLDIVLYTSQEDSVT